MRRAIKQQLRDTFGITDATFYNWVKDGVPAKDQQEQTEALGNCLFVPDRRLKEVRLGTAAVFLKTLKFNLRFSTTNAYHGKNEAFHSPGRSGGEYKR